MVHLLHPNKFYAAEPHKLNVSIAKEMHEEIKHYQNGLTEERGIIMKLFVIPGPYFPVFGLNTGKYGPEITPYLDTFQAVCKILA